MVLHAGDLPSTACMSDVLLDGARQRSLVLRGNRGRGEQAPLPYQGVTVAVKLQSAD